jgi:hypothetical protein
MEQMCLPYNVCGRSDPLLAIMPCAISRQNVHEKFFGRMIRRRVTDMRIERPAEDEFVPEMPLVGIIFDRRPLGAGKGFRILVESPVVRVLRPMPGRSVGEKTP